VFNALNDGSTSATVPTSPFKTGAGGSSGVDLAGGTTTSRNGNSVSKIDAPKIYVHVVGEVVRPGLYILQSGARLADAIFAADGFSRFADQASVNLARLITDGEQIVVSRVGGSVGGAISGPVPSSNKSLVNLNRSSEPEIEGLPGVGPTLAGRIIDWRVANGGFRSKADLQKVAGIGDKLFAQLKDLVTL
jgi:competence protein ComEA